MPESPIAFVTPRFGRGQGGVGTSAERIAAHWRGSGRRVTVFELCEELPRGSVRELGVDHVQVARSDRGKDSMQFLVDVLRQRAAGHVLVGFYAGGTAFPLWLAARWLACPLLLMARGNDVDLDPFGSGGAEQLQAWNEADGVLCVSREMEQKVRAWAPRARTRYVPNGIDADAFALGAPAPAAAPPESGRLRLGMFGEVKTKKGLEQLLAEMDPERFELELTGSLQGDTEKMLHGALMLRPELAARVHYHPQVASRAELLAQYAKCDVVCLPSLHEGMANVMLEAMALGKPVLASAVGGALDVLRDGEDGLLFPPWQDGALAAALRRLREVDLAALGARAAVRVRSEFRADQERERLLSAVSELLSSPR